MVEKGRFESCCILCQSEDNKSFWFLDLENKYEPPGFREKLRTGGTCTAWSKVEQEVHQELMTLLREQQI